MLCSDLTYRKGVLRSMLRSLRVLLVTILITLSLPLLQCDAQPAAAVKTGQTPLKVEVQLQSASGRVTDYMVAEATAAGHRAHALPHPRAHALQPLLDQ